MKSSYSLAPLGDGGGGSGGGGSGKTGAGGGTSGKHTPGGESSSDGSVTTSSTGLISHMVFPGDEEGVQARIRWHSTKFSMKQLLGEARRLKAELEAVVPLLPGANVYRTG